MKNKMNYINIMYWYYLINLDKSMLRTIKWGDLTLKNNLIIIRRSRGVITSFYVKININ